MPCHGEVVRRVVPGDVEKPFLKVIFVEYLINFRGKEGPGVRAGEMDE